MYDSPAFNYSGLIQCYIAEFGIEPSHDERRHEMAQNTASVWLHEQLKTHPLRTMNPAEADLFILPIEAYVSATLNKPCDTGLANHADPTEREATTEGSTHAERISAIIDALSKSNWWQRHNGRDHLVICAWWGAARSWGKWEAQNKPSLWRMMRASAILATIDEYFARGW